MRKGKGEEPLVAHGLAHVRDLVSQVPESIREVLVEAGSRHAGPLTRALSAAGVAWREASRQELSRLGGEGARQALARLHPFPYVSLAELLAGVPERALVVALDSVTDPGNLGALLRSAAFFGVSGVLLQERRSAPVTATVIRRSAGAALSVPVARVTNLVRALGQLREAGFWVYGSVVQGGVAPREESFGARSCVVLGAEDKGLRPLVVRECDVSLTVPGCFESLNVAAFGTVLFYEWATKKSLDKAPSQR